MDIQYIYWEFSLIVIVVVKCTFFYFLSRSLSAALSEAKDCMYRIQVNLNDYTWGKSVYYEVQDSSTD